MTENYRAKVLLLGNGIAREYYNGAGWNKVFEQIRIDGHFALPSEQYQMSMPLKADMFAKNNLDKFLELLKIDLPHDKEHNFFPQLLNLDFDYILTTNYTYEAECALLNLREIEISLINSTHYLSGNKYFNNNREYSNNETTEQHRAEIDNLQKYEDLISTYNDIENKKIWHIHGEAAYPNTMVLGYSAYAQLLHTYMEKIEAPENGWLNAFVNGDVYILGFGMDFAEIDLWWLLQHKSETWKKRKGKKPDTLYFNPQPYCPDNSAILQYMHGTSEWCKIKMLRSCGVKIKNIRFNNIQKDDSNNNYESTGYKEFYELAKDKIEESIENRKQEL